jgi:hypothetical protein
LKYSRLSVYIVEDEDFTSLGQLRSSNIEFISRIIMEKEHHLLVVIGTGNSMTFLEEMDETCCQSSQTRSSDELCCQVSRALNTQLCSLALHALFLELLPYPMLLSAFWTQWRTFHGMVKPTPGGLLDCLIRLPLF